MFGQQGPELVDHHLPVCGMTGACKEVVCGGFISVMTESAGAIVDEMEFFSVTL